MKGIALTIFALLVIFFCLRWLNTTKLDPHWTGFYFRSKADVLEKGGMKELLTHTPEFKTDRLKTEKECSDWGWATRAKLVHGESEVEDVYICAKGCRKNLITGRFPCDTENSFVYTFWR